MFKYALTAWEQALKVLKKFALPMALVGFGVLASHLPLIGYCRLLINSVSKDLFRNGNVSLMIEDVQKDTEWFKRYFTGPPSDAEMIDFWKRGRADFEAMAHDLRSSNTFCAYPKIDGNMECVKLKERYGISITSEGPIVINSIYCTPSKSCGSVSRTALYFTKTLPLQSWIAGRFDWVIGWKKSLVHIPDATPPSLLGLPDNFPVDARKILSGMCQETSSLDTMPPALKRDIEKYGAFDQCAMRPLEGRWFLVLYPVRGDYWENQFFGE